MDTTKTCNTCNTSKDATEFYKSTKSKDGLFGQCKKCNKAYKSSDKARIIQEKYRLSYKGKETEDRRNKSDIRKSWVKGSKRKTYNTKYRNTPKRKAYQKKYYEDHKNEYLLRYYKRKRILEASYHPDRDDKKILCLYKLSDKITKETGIPQHVDHIYPISKGGVHHEDNLQVIPASINLEKSNSLSYTHPDIKHWKDIPPYLLEWIELRKLTLQLN